MNITWNPLSLVPNGFSNNITVDIACAFLNIEGSEFNIQSRALLKATPNDGMETVLIDSSSIVLCPRFLHSASPSNYFSTCPIFIKVSISPNQHLPSTTSIWSGVLFLKGSLSLAGSQLQECGDWQSQNEAILNRVNNGSKICPPSVFVASFDLTFTEEDMASYDGGSRDYHEVFMMYFHPDIYKCYRETR